MTRQHLTIRLAWLGTLAGLAVIWGGCGAPVVERRTHTIDETALVAVPIGPHGKGPLAQPGEVTVDAQYAHTAPLGNGDLARHGDAPHLYLDHLAGARLAYGATPRTEVAVHADYSYRGWASSTAPELEATLPYRHTFWGGLGLRVHAGGHDAVRVLYQAEVSLGNMPYARHVNTVTERFQIDHTGILGAATSTPLDQTVSDAVTQSNDLGATFSTGFTLQFGREIRGEFGLHGQLFPLFPGRRVIVQNCYEGGKCDDTGPDQVAAWQWTPILTTAVVLTVPVTEQIALISQAWLHVVPARVGTLTWPGLALAVRWSPPSEAAAEPAPPPDLKTSQPPSPLDDIDSRLWRVP